MSTDTPTPTFRTGIVDPEQAFERYVETDPMVCNSCYERVEAVEGSNVESKAAVGEVVTRHDDGRATGIEPLRESSAAYDWQPWDHCPECGQLGLVSPDETLSVDRAQRRTIPLSRRLTERGIPHRWRLLLWFVTKAKRREDLAGKDRDIAARAVEFAVRESR